MTDTMERLVIEHLLAIRATQADHSERLSRIESRISNLEVPLRERAETWNDLRTSRDKDVLTTYPEMTKNMSFPENPPGNSVGSSWNSMTAITARARNPSIPGA